VTNPSLPDFGEIIDYCFAVHGFMYQDTRGDITYDPDIDPKINKFGFDTVTFPVFDNTADVVVSGDGFPNVVGEYFVVRGVKNLNEPTSQFPYLSQYIIGSFSINNIAGFTTWEQTAPSVKTIQFDSFPVQLRAAVFNVTEDLFPVATPVCLLRTVQINRRQKSEVRECVSDCVLERERQHESST
jgi:hypothetical protein